MKRVILKKTTYLNKNQRGLSKRISTYLERYVSEVGKAQQKHGEAPWKKMGGETEPKWLLPSEKTGVFYTGGFLGEAESPGSTEANKQKGWVKRFTGNYIRALEKCPKRRNDGLRFILSLAPEAVSHLTQANISVDQAMREIWRTTIELYRERHGWSDPKDDLAWIAGAHHDTDNTHMHILLFPTTKSGKLLRTNNARGKERVNDLNELVAMTNIASEIFWRELLPLKLQSPEFQALLAQEPETEPPLPTIESFKARSGIPGEPDYERREEIPEIPKVLLESAEDKEEKDLEYGEIPILTKVRERIGKLRGRIQLRAMVGVALKWSNKKLKFFGILKSLSNPEECTKIRKNLDREFPMEAQDMESLRGLSPLIKNKRSRQALEELLTSDTNYVPALLARIAGETEPTAIKEETLIEWAGRLANVFESATSKKDTQTKLANIVKEGQLTLAQKSSEDKRTLIYRRIKRALEKVLKVERPSENFIALGIDCINKIIRGSKRIALTLEARNQEATNSVSVTTDGKFAVRNEMREYSLTRTERGYEFKVEENEGKPWPAHLDPETVIEPLKDMIQRGTLDFEGDINLPRTKKQDAMELTDIDSLVKKVKKQEEDEGPLELLIRLRGRKNISRRRKALEIMKRYRMLETGEAGMVDGPEMDIK